MMFGSPVSLGPQIEMAFTARRVPFTATSRRATVCHAASVPPHPLMKIASASAATAAAFVLMLTPPASAELNKYEYAAGGEFDNG